MMGLSGGIVILVIWVVSVSGPCPENCEVIQNPSLPTCNQDTGACFRGCKAGYYGSTCNISCDVNCQHGTCQQRDGSCTCEPGYTFNAGSCDVHEGVSCESNDHCLNNTCIYPGRPDCLKGCTPGWFGKICQQRCSPHCNCDEVTGVCNTCIPRWYGADCRSECSPGCVNKDCHRNGTCVHGCTTGTYGDQCDLKCSQHCVSGCDQLSGDCIQCEAGRYGQTCQFKCSAGCAGANNDCERDGNCTGECTIGCESGFFGSFCNLTCENCEGGDCDRATGECRNKENLPFIIGGGALFLVFVLAGLTACCLKRIQGVVYDTEKWRRRLPSALQDVQPVASQGHTELEEQVTVTPHRVGPILPIRQTSYIEPRHSGNFENLQTPHQEDEPQGAAAPPSDRMLQEVLRRSDEWSERPDSYVLPHYCEVDEEGIATPPQTPILSVAAEVHATGGDIRIPPIAECFGPTGTEDSSPDLQPLVENYDHLNREGIPRIGGARVSSYTQADDEVRTSLASSGHISTARPDNYIEPRHSGCIVLSPQPTISAGASDQQEDERQAAVAPPSDDALIARDPKPAQGAEAPAETR